MEEIWWLITRKNGFVPKTNGIYSQLYYDNEYIVLPPL